MTKKEKIKAEQIKAEVRKAMDEILDDEFNRFIQNVEEGKKAIPKKSLADIKNELWVLVRYSRIKGSESDYFFDWL